MSMRLLARMFTAAVVMSACACGTQATEVSLAAPAEAPPATPTPDQTAEGEHGVVIVLEPKSRELTASARCLLNGCPESAWTAAAAGPDLQCTAEPEASPISSDGDVLANYHSVPNYGDLPKVLGWGDSPTSLVIEENTRYPCYGVGTSPDDIRGGRCSGVHVVDTRCPTTPLRSWQTGKISGGSALGPGLALTTNFPFEYGPPMLSAVDLTSAATLPIRLDRFLGREVPELAGFDTARPTQVVRVEDQTVLLLFAAEDRTELVAVTTEPRVRWKRSLASGLAAPAMADGLGRSFLSLSDGTLEALGSDGERLWSRAGVKPVAVFQDTLFLDDGSVLDPGSGELRYHRMIRGELRVTDQRVYQLSECGAECTRVELSDRRNGSLIAEHWIPHNAPEVLVLSDGRLLVGERRTHIDANSSPWNIPLGFHVSVLDDEGTLTPLFVYRSVSEGIKGWILVDDFLVLLRNTYPHNTSYPHGSYLVGIAAPGLRPERNGWLTSHGNMSGTWTPEPMR